MPLTGSWSHPQLLWARRKGAGTTTHVHMACGYSNQLTSIWPQYLRGGSQLRYSSRIFKTKNRCSYVAYVVTNKMLKSNVPWVWSSSCSSQPEGLSCKLSVTTVLHRLGIWSPDGAARDHPWLTWKIYTPTCYIHFFEKCCLCKDTCHIHPHSSSQRFQRYMSSAMTSGLGRVLSSLCRETPKVKIAISWPGTQQWSEVRAVEAFKLRLIMMPPTNNRITIVAFMNTETIPEIWNICILYIYCI